MTGGPPSAGRVLVATRNPGKLRELVPMFASVGLVPTDLSTAGLPELPEEDGLEAFETFAENALAKARYFHRLSGLPTVADDSGLEATGLGGAPGVRSKRFSGRSELTGSALDAANNETLLRALGPGADRRARFVCAVAFVDAGRELVELGSTTGRLLGAPRGGGGFGYDPLFLSDELGVTFGEAAASEKAAVSHRGRAFRALVGRLAALGGGAGGGAGR